MMQVTIKRVLFLVFCLIGCGYTGLKRTCLDKWERKPFPTLYISIDLPNTKKDIYQKIFDGATYQKNVKAKGLTFLFHPVYRGAATDALYLIEFRAIVLTPEQHALYQDKRHLYATDFRAFKETEFFPEITEYKIDHPNGTTPLRCFRKDIKNINTGDIVLATITYMNDFEGNTDYRDKDIDAIKRILNSIKFLDGDQK